MKSTRFRALALSLACLCPLAASAQWVDFAQLDGSSESTTLVLVRALPALATPAPLVSAVATRWSSGEAASLGYTQRVAVVDGTHHWLLGAGVSVDAYRSRDPLDPRHESGPALRAQSELSGPAPGGWYYTLLQASTFRQAWFASAQINPDALPFGLELSRYHETGYQSTSAVLRVGLARRWFLRLGAQRANDATRPFVGLAYNGF